MLVLVMPTLATRYGRSVVVSNDRQLPSSGIQYDATLFTVNDVQGREYQHSLVAGKLPEPAEGDIEHQPIAPRSSLDKHSEIKKVLPSHDAFFSQRIRHLPHLKLH